MSEVWKEDRRLYDTAKYHCGGWRNALVAAGLTVRFPLTREDVIAAIQRRHRSGKAIAATWKEDVLLYASSKRLCGSWRKALRAAGLEPDRPRVWSKQDVIVAIQQRHRNGLPLGGVWNTDRSLSAAARMHFGSWYDALTAAGILCSRRRWNKELVISCIREYHRNGVLMSEVWKRDRSLLCAARRYFGGWSNALDQAGIPRKRRRKWSKEAVLQELREWYCGHEPAPSTYCAAKQYFGGIKQAWEVAGLDPPNRKWSEQRVIEVIQDRYVQGLPNAFVGFGDKSLACAASRYFGTWPDALLASGLSRKLGERRTRSWNAEKVIEAIRAWHKSGRLLSKVHCEDRPLYAAAASYCGNWRTAVRAAGLGEVRQQWTPQRVVCKLQDWWRQRSSFRGIYKEEQLLYAAAIRIFGSWGTAIQAAGLKPTSENHDNTVVTRAVRCSGRRRL